MFKICVDISNRLSHGDQAGMSVLGTRIINLRQTRPNVSTAYMMLCFSDEGKYFYFIQLHTRYFSKSYTNFSKFLFHKIVKSISPNFLFRKIVKSISFMENETEEAIKMQKLKKTNSSPLGNRTCLLHWCLKA